MLQNRWEVLLHFSRLWRWSGDFLHFLPLSVLSWIITFMWNQSSLPPASPKRSKVLFNMLLRFGSLFTTRFPPLISAQNSFSYAGWASCHQLVGMYHQDSCSSKRLLCANFLLLSPCLCSTQTSIYLLPINDPFAFSTVVSQRRVFLQPGKQM